MDIELGLAGLGGILPNSQKIARAIEQDAGMELPDVRQALTEARAGAGRVTTPEQLLVRSARAKTGLSQQAFADRIATPRCNLARLGARTVCTAGRGYMPAAAD